jgi:hypothetical protein
VALRTRRAKAVPAPPHSHSIVSEGGRPAWMLALWGTVIILYPHFYCRRTSAFDGTEDGFGLRGGYSSASIVDDRQGL